MVACGTILSAACANFMCMNFYHTLQNVWKGEREKFHKVKKNIYLKIKETEIETSGSVVLLNSFVKSYA